MKLAKLQEFRQAAYKHLAVPPKPRGKSQGWTPGKRRSRKNRYPTVKKTAAKPRKQQQKSA